MSRDELETRMWKLLHEACDGEPYATVRISKLADERLPVPHKQWTTETVRRWANEDLVLAYGNGTSAALTDRGAWFEDLSRYE